MTPLFVGDCGDQLEHAACCEEAQEEAAGQADERGLYEVDDAQSEEGDAGIDDEDLSRFDLAAEQCSADEQGADDAHGVEGLNHSRIL